ncbi:MAG: fibronectin type III domain-containing protein, partial [Gammaproteobacteria bacterium]
SSFFRSYLLRGATTAAITAILLSLASLAAAQTTKITLTISPTAVTKIYDGVVDENPVFAYTATGYTSGDSAADVFKESPLERSAGDDAGVYTFTLKPAADVLTTAALAKYDLELVANPGAFTITKKEVTYTTTAAHKIYDSTTDGPVNFSGGFATGDIVAGDHVYPGGGDYSQEGIGTNLTITGVDLAGNNGGNYMLSTGSSFSGNITVRTTAYISTAADKLWDDETFPPGVYLSRGLAASGSAPHAMSPYAVYGGDFEPGSRIEGDDLCIVGGAFTQKEVGNDIQITGFQLGSPVSTVFMAGTPTEQTEDICTPGSGLSQNYELSPDSSIRGDITRRQIRLADVRITKAYDGTTASTQTFPTVTGDGVIGRLGDGIAIRNLGYNSRFANVGNKHGSLFGKPATGLLPCPENPAVCDDDDKPAFRVIVELAPGANADHTKFYDLGKLVGTVGMETFESIDERVFETTTGTEVRIIPKEVTLSNVQLTKVYDGDTSIAGAEITATIGGAAAGEMLTLRIKDGADATFAAATADSGITISGFGADDLELVSGNALTRSFNYSLPASITATGVITQRPLCITFNGAGMLPPTGAGLRDIDLMSILTTDVCKGLFSGHALGTTATTIQFTGEVNVETQVGDISVLSAGNLALATGAPNDNYMLDFRGGQWYYTSSSKSNVLVLTPTNNLIRVYGEPLTAIAFSVAPQAGSDFMTGDTAASTFFTTSPITVTGSGIGEHAFSFVASPAYATGINVKYDFVIDPVMRHTITKRPLHIAAGVFQFFPGGLAQAQAATLKFTVGTDPMQGYAPGEGQAEALSGALALSSDTDAAGNYAILIGTLAATANYAIASFTSRAAFVVEPPEAPRITAVLQSSQNGQPALVVRWEPGAGGVPVESWDVNYKLATELSYPSNPRIPTLPSTTRSAVLTGLNINPNALYNVIVIAESLTGAKSAPSAEVNQTTHAIPPAPVIDMSAPARVSAGKAANTISWTYGGSGVDAAMEYYLTVVKDTPLTTTVFPSIDILADSLPMGVEFIRNAAGDGGTLRGLEADERYHARLRILAKSGVLSAVSNIPIFNSAQAPGRPGNFNVNPGSPSVSVRNRELALSWLPPSNPGPTGARIVGYDVRWRVAAQVEENWVPNNDGTRVPGGGSARQFNIADLTQGAQYIAQVRAASQIGSSGWREGTGTPVATSQTDATLSSLEVLNADSTATFTLMPPFTLGVNNYNLAVARDTTSVVIKAKAAQSLARFNLSTSTTPVFTARIPDEGVVVSLVNTAMIMGTTMVVNVTAPNGKDKVVYRVIVTFQTDPPSAPRNLRLSVGDLAGELKVDWALPESLNGGPVLSYTVRWKLTTDTNYAAADVQTRVVSTPPEAADRTATITGLTGGMAYDVQVLATNSGGDGAYAAAVQGTPPEPSGVSTLSSLAVLNDKNAGVTLDRIFSPAITTYTANVPNGVAAITLTPTTTHAGATVSVTDGTTPQSLASKAKSNPFPLTVGSNTLTTTVTAEDASTTAYVLTVTRLFPLPDAPAAPTLNAIRDALEVAWVAPADNGSDILNYRVRWRTSEIDPDGSPGSGDETAAGAWQNASGPDNDGQQVGVSPLTYTILNLTNGTDYDVQVAAVTASGAGDFSPAATAAPQANDATLSNLAVIGSDTNAITLSSSFAAQTETYTASVDSDIASVTLTATPTAAAVHLITLTRDSAPSQTLTAATASNPQRLNYGATTLVLVVTAADTRTTMTYTLIFTRSTGLPFPPTGLTVTNAIESLDLSWQAPVNNGGLSITDYSLRWAQSPAAIPSWLNAGGATGQLLGSAAVTYTIPNLKISQEYLVQVAARNTNGLSTWSPAVTGTAVAAANDADLRSLTVVDSAGGVVGLVETFDRAITAYTASVANEIDSVSLTATYAGSSLTISGSNSPDSGTQSDPVGLNIGANPIPMVVSSSDSSVMKTYTLTVTRAAGLPDKIDPPVAKPTGPREKRITVTWVWDGSGNNGSPHLGFDVQVRLTAEPGDPDNTWMPDADGVNLRIATAREHIFENLEPAGGSFQTRVRVVNGIGDGAWSEIVDSRASGPPDAPTLRTVTGVAGALDIAWTHAAFTGGDGVNLSSQHDVRWRTSATDPDGAANSGDETVAGAWQDGTGDDDDGKRITPSQLSHTITGLSGGMEYDVQVRVYNEFPVNTNLSDWSAIQKGTPIRHEVVITPAAATKVYGAADPDVDYTASFLGDDTKSSVFGTDVPFARVVGETVNDYGYVRKSTLPFQDARFAGKYTITVATTNKFTITTKEVTYASTAADKVYDGNTAAPANLGGSFRGIIVDTVNGVSIDDSARLSVSGGAFADKVVETNKAVTGFTLGGDAAGNYMLNTGGSSVTGDITALATTLTATAAERVYNADTAVGSVATTFSPPILTGDTVTVDTSAAVYADANIGAAKTINGLSTSGADVGNYAITIEGTGTVTKRPLRVAAGGSGAGTESAGDFVVPTALLSDRSLLTIVGGVTNEGLAGSDTAAQVLTGEIAAGARTGGAATGGGTAPLTIGNLAVDTNPPGSNYELFFTAGVFSFTDSGKQTLVLTPVLTTTRVYGEPDPSSYLFSVAEQSGSRFLGADTADTTFFGATSPVTRAAGDDVKAYPFSVVASPDYAAGVEAKYIFVIAQGAQYTITAKELTIAAVTLTKVYNGDDAVTGATLSGGALTGVVGSESFTLGLIDGSDGEYAKADVGTALTVNNVDSADLELTGDDAASKPANYTLADPASVTGVITAKEVTVADAT